MLTNADLQVRTMADCGANTYLSVHIGFLIMPSSLHSEARTEKHNVLQSPTITCGLNCWIKSYFKLVLLLGETHFSHSLMKTVFVMQELKHKQYRNGPAFSHTKGHFLFLFLGEVENKFLKRFFSLFSSWTSAFLKFDFFLIGR